MFRIVKQAFAVTAIIGVLIAVDALAAYANSGEVHLTNSCAGGGGTVLLHNNVGPLHRIDVISTIPGRDGFTNHYYDTTGNPGSQVIWAKSWTSPKAGTVTLKIYKPDGTVESTSTESISQPNCTTTTQPTVTTTIPESTTIPVTVTTAKHNPPTTKIDIGTATSVVAPATKTELPKTGSSSLPLGAIGVFVSMAGAFVVARTRRNVVR